MNTQIALFKNLPECFRLTTEDIRNAAYIDVKPTIPKRQMEVLQVIKLLKRGNYHEIHKRFIQEFGECEKSSIVGRINELRTAGLIETEYALKRSKIDESDKDEKPKIRNITYYQLSKAGKEKLRCQ